MVNKWPILSLIAGLLVKESKSSWLLVLDFAGGRLGGLTAYDPFSGEWTVGAAQTLFQSKSKRQ
jgi:hypothetical protein